MGVIYKNGIAYGGGGGSFDYLEITYAQWEAMSEAEKADGIYIIVDYPSGTSADYIKKTGTLGAGSTTISFTDDAFGSNTACIYLGASVANLNYTNMAQSGTTITLTFPAQQSAVTIHAIFTNF